MTMLDLAERGFLPDWLIRIGIRRLLQRRVAIHAAEDNLGQTAEQATMALAQSLRQQPIAIHTVDANTQHYEVPAALFELMLGPHQKYSCGFWPHPSTTLPQSEKAMLELTCERAEVRDGMSILDLGCGWGSLSLFMAQRYPKCRILGVSNSASQRISIQSRAADLGLTNLTIVTANVADFSPDSSFDRIVSVEMFEHIRNYQRLLSNIASWINDDGKLFVHVFCHRDRPYTFETDGDNDWMARHFFTGGQMPTAGLFAQFQDDLVIEQSWQINGLHYARTCHAWLERLDRRSRDALKILASDAPISAPRQLQRWRIFLMACEELFRFHAGNEWFVLHLRFAGKS